MFTWLLAVPFLGSLISILTPAFKGIMEGLVEYFKSLWHGVKTSNYGTWTLVITAALLAWMFTSCPEQKCTSKTPITKSVIGKTSDSINPSDTFRDWFGLR